MLLAWVSFHSFTSSVAAELHVMLGFYSLFSVTEEPFVTSGGELDNTPGTVDIYR